MKKGILSIAASFLAIFFAAAQANGVLKHVASWTEMLQEAKQEDKLIFIDCYFTGCLPCAQMDKQVFPNELVKEELSRNFIAVKLDVFKEKLGDTINMKYGLHGYPTFLVLNQQGQLLSMFSGYKDAGLFLKELASARQKATEQTVLSGFTNVTTVAYPDFYKKYYDREDQKRDLAAANSWIKQQKDWTAEPVTMSIFRTRDLAREVEDYLLANYSTYLARYGSSLLLEKAVEILSGKVDEAVRKTTNEAAFRNFLVNAEKQFPSECWSVMQFQLGFHYYGAVARDTMALLQFINEKPLIHANYVGALYGQMLVKKQLNESTLPLLCSWANAAVNEESAFDIMLTAANMHKRNNDLAGYKKFIEMAIKKAKKYKMPAESYEKMLAAK